MPSAIHKQPCSTTSLQVIDQPTLKPAREACVTGPGIPTRLISGANNAASMARCACTKVWIHASIVDQSASLTGRYTALQQKTALNLFTYGSLMFEPVWSRLVSGHYPASPASLAGFVRRCVKDESYPVIFRGLPTDTVEGVLYRNLTAGDLDLLDAFEGDYYVREAVTLRLPDGSACPAQTYVLKDQYRHLADDREWDVDRFASTDIHHFLTQYTGFPVR